MGTMTFLLPPGLPADAVQELDRASVAGGPDSTPYPTEVLRQNDRLIVRRNLEESGYLVVPWTVEGAGRLMTSTATLIEREQPYPLQIELARGKLNQLRNQAADWISGGLQMPAVLQENIRAATLAFAQAVTQAPTPSAAVEAQRALARAFHAADSLVDVYIGQVFEVRHQRQPHLDTILACRVPDVPGSAETTAIRRAFTAVQAPFSWNDVQPGEDDYQWQAQDDVLAWAEVNQLPVHGGPLLDFSKDHLPGWLGNWQGDLPSLAGFCCAYVENVVRRYRGRVRSWELATSGNAAEAFGLGEDELLWLTVRLAEAARQAEPNLDLSIGLAQPWGEYMALQPRTHSPFLFADTLIRSGINLARLDLELILGVEPRGSYCRDTLEISRLIDLYSLLGVPLQVTLGYPSSRQDPNGDPSQSVTAGAWRDGFTPAMQTAWVESHVALCLCKPAVRAVVWTNYRDGLPQALPACGLLHVDGHAKPALARVQELRETHLAGG